MAPQQMPGNLQSAFYLSFNGNCKEAMLFYKNCFDGDLEIQLVSDAPNSEHLPLWVKQCVLQATLRALGITIMGTDLNEGEDRLTGNNMAIHLSLLNEEAFHCLVKRLSEHSLKVDEAVLTRSGKKVQIKDRFGINWLVLHYNPEPILPARNC